MSGREDSEYAAKWAVERVVYQLVTDKDPEAVEERPPYPGADPAFGTRRHPLALPALAAAHRVLREAQAVEEEAIRHARGQGKTWQEVVDALFTDVGTGRNRFADEARREQMTIRVAGWRYAVHRRWPAEELSWNQRYSREEVLYWRCWTCRGSIKEAHPEFGKDAQEGHLPGCARGRKWA